MIARERDDLAARRRRNPASRPKIVEKMVEGGINKFLAEITLLGQPFVKDDKQTVEKLLAAKKAKVLGFRFFVVGEGIEKKTDRLRRRSDGAGRPDEGRRLTGRAPTAMATRRATSASCSSSPARR